MSLKSPVNPVIPVGLGTLPRPGSYLLGQLLPARRQPFVCLAGTQVEEIELAFGEGVPLPQKIDGRRIENRNFIYTADYQLNGRSLKVRREFISRVSGQVCPADVETEIAQPLRDVFASNAVRMAFAAPSAAKPTPSPAQPGVLEIKRKVVVDHPLKLDFIYWINPDCSSLGIAGVRIIEEPGHGKLATEDGTGFINFKPDSPLQVCNRRRTEGAVLRYRPEEGYLGPDSLTVEVIYNNGTSWKRHYAVTVDPKPAPSELARTAVAGRQIRIGTLVNVELDCSTTPFASVRMVEDPAHGEAVLKADTAFTNFAKDNPRFECNKQKSDVTGVFYRAEDGYTGKDGVTVEVVYPDGNVSSVRYLIDVK